MERQTFDTDNAYWTDCDVSYNRFNLLWVSMAPFHVPGTRALIASGLQMRQGLFRAKELLCSLRYCEYIPLRNYGHECVLHGTTVLLL